MVAARAPARRRAPGGGLSPAGRAAAGHQHRPGRATNFADETGYLANARVLTGGIPGELSQAAFYRGGYSLLLVPAYWLGDGPQAQCRYVLATNALLSSLVFPLVWVLLRRVFRVPVRTALAAAFLAALYPCSPSGWSGSRAPRPGGSGPSWRPARPWRARPP